MRRAEKEITDRAQIDSIIQEAGVCRIGLVDGDEAYIVPMNFGYADGCLWFHCAKEGRKMDLVNAMERPASRSTSTRASFWTVMPTNAATTSSASWGKAGSALRAHRRKGQKGLRY